MGNLTPKFQKDYSGGVVTNVNENLLPPNSVKHGINVDFDEEIGSVVTRLGTGLVGAQLVAGNTVLGLHDFRDSDSTNHALLAAINASGGATSVVYKVTGTPSTIVTGLTASKKMRFLTFLDSTLMVNGTDAPRSYDGSTVITTGGAFDLANIPFAEPSLGIEWLDRVYLAGDTANPDRLYYSSTPSSGAISWTSGNGFIDIEPEDGGGTITALGKVPGYLMIFKERSLKRWNFDSAFPETLIEQGTPSQESVINSGGVCAFFSASSRDTRGFYITNGGRPVPISHDRAKNVKKWVDAIPRSYEANISGWGTPRFFMWSIGDVTVDGVDYKNVVLRWNKVLDQWSIRTYPSEFRVFSSYVDGSGNNVIVAGDDDGNVIELDKDSTYTDYDSANATTTPIHFEIHHQEENFGYNQQKELSERIIVNSKNMDDARIEIYADGKQHNNGKIDGRISEIPIKTVAANHFEIAVKGKVNGARGILKEIEFANVQINQSYGN